MTSIFFIITIICFLWRGLSAQEAKPINGYSGDSLVLKCGHSIDTEHINVIAWHLNQESIVQYLPGQAYPLQVNDLKYQNRSSVDYPSGDLTLNDLQWSDSGKYLCIIVTQGGGAENGNSYKLSVYVLPKQVDVECFSDESDSSKVSCTEYDANIYSIKCSVTSYPESDITLIEGPTHCDKTRDVRHCNVRQEGHECVVKLEKVCPGIYICQAFYKDGNQEQTISGIRVSVQQSGTEGEVTDEKKVATWVIIVAVVIVIITILLVILVICCIRYPQLCHNVCECTNNDQQNRGNLQNGQANTTEPVSSELIALNTINASCSDTVASSENEPDEVVNQRNEYILSRQKMVEEAYVQGEQVFTGRPELTKIEMMLQTQGGSKFTIGVEKPKRQDRPSAKQSGSVDSFESLAESNTKAIENRSSNDN